ncbi:MAG: class I SAM-dependent DNA methyltransferase [Boseongicola sp.]
MADRETLDVYGDRAADYADMVTQMAPDRHLQAFIDAVPKGGKVMDLGCGHGRSTALMIEAGLQAEALDASPEFAEIALKKFGVKVAIAEFEALDTEAAYDGVFANFSLLHSPKAEMPGHLARIARSLQPDGVFHLGLKTGEGEYRDSLGRFYAYYSDAEISGLMQNNGFTVLSRDFGAEKGLDGTVAPWIVLLARKTS